MIKKTLPVLLLLAIVCQHAMAQQVLETGGKKMPDEWIDKDTRHKIIKLTRVPGRNMSFYFHNNPFVDNKMVFYHADGRPDLSGVKKQEIYNSTGEKPTLYIVDLNTLKTEKLSQQPAPKKGEIVSAPLREAFYQVRDSVFAVNIDTKKERLVFIFPPDFKGDITSINADGSLLGGVLATPEEKEILRNNPEKHDYFNKIYEAKLRRTLFTIDIKAKKLNQLFSDTAWLNHVQFSSTDPDIMMFCHEGPWHKVDRIWTINVQTKKITRVHKRIMDMEIAGHEWFSHDGKTIWYDLQQPRGATFFVAGYDLATGKEKKYQLERNEWSVHYTTSWDEKWFAGDGGDPGAVAKAPDGKWIYFFKPEGDRFASEKLVNMKHHGYKLEPNVHFSPDGKWIIFRANFEGESNVYAVAIKKS